MRPYELFRLLLNTKTKEEFIKLLRLHRDNRNREDV